MKVADTGDFVLTSAKGWDLGGKYEYFGSGNNRGGHGGLRSDQAAIPLVLSGYGIKKGITINAASIEDVGATVMDVMGVPLHPQAEGRSLKQARNSIH